jgi:hypothetical protein
MNDVRTFATENPAVTSRAMDAVRARNGRAFSEAIHDVAATLQVAVGWHEADVLAEALSHHYTDTVQTYTFFDPRIEQGVMDAEIIYLRRELVRKADEGGLSLVEKPAESWYVTDRYPVEGESWAGAHEVPRLRALAMARKKFGWYAVVVLSGKCRKLASAI